MGRRGRLKDGGYTNVVSPAIRRKDVEKKLRWVLALLRRAKRPNTGKACLQAGTSLKTFRRYKELYATGGEEAVREALRLGGPSIFQDDPRLVAHLAPDRPPQKS